MKLRLEDIDWECGLILVLRAKEEKIQTYLSLLIGGNAIVEYLWMVRAQCFWREIFLKLTAPFGPLSRGALYGLTSKRISALRIETISYDRRYLV